jgi:peptide/nickel transport system substrate-binding protein/microcin C transport system substrate-binding protein
MKIFGLFFLIASISFAAVNPNVNAPKGGNYIRNIGGEPTTLHPITSTDWYSQRVHEYVLDSLLARNYDTYEWQPRIAEKWEISKDNKVFTFFLRKDAVFHDGTPLTADDVKFSFDAIFEPKYNAAHLRPYYEGIEKLEAVDKYTIKAYAKDAYFKNFDVIAELSVIPKHIYSDVEKSKKMNQKVIGCGPYMIESYDKGQKIVMKKFDKWFGSSYENYKGTYNFERITYRFVKDENVELEMVKKGELDYVDLTAEAYEKKTTGAPWGEKVLKFKIENSQPKGYGFYGWNFRKTLFQDKNVRLALSHLVNRDEMNKKFRFGYSTLAAGPIYRQSEYASANLKAIEFSPTKAQELLKKVGWADTDKNGILDKVIDGKKTELKFTLIHANKDAEKYHTLFKEDLKKAGIEMEIKYLEWNSFLKLVDEGNFDAVNMGWGGGDIDLDPKQIWHSSSAVVGGSNFIAYKNPEVDKLIEEARVTNDRNKRIKIIRQIDEKIANDVPYSFLFNDRFGFYGNSARIGKPADTLKFRVGHDYWWIKP